MERATQPLLSITDGRYIFWSGIDDVLLFFTRGSLASLAIISTIVFFSKVRPSPMWQMIPRYVRYFASLWTTILWGFVSFIFFSGTFPSGTEWFRAMYGYAFFGTLWSWSWCIWYLTRQDVAARIIEQYIERLSGDLRERVTRRGDRD